MLFRNLRLFCFHTSNLKIYSTVLCKQHSLWLETTLRHESRKYSSLCLRKTLIKNFIICCQRNFTSSHLHYKIEDNWPQKRSWFERTFADDPYDKKFLIRSGLTLYEACTDGVDLEHFLQKCNLSDSYFSWFRITELHVWMCIVRAMAEGEEGKIVRKGILEALWNDASVRAKKFKVGSVSSRQKYMLDLNSQFMASLFLYDEGLQSGDAILASALWYRLFDSKCDNAAILANAVHYVRKQIYELENFSKDDILLNGKVSFSSI